MGGQPPVFTGCVSVPGDGEFAIRRRPELGPMTSHVPPMCPTQMCDPAVQLLLKRPVRRGDVGGGTISRDVEPPAASREPASDRSRSSAPSLDGLAQGARTPYASQIGACRASGLMSPGTRRAIPASTPRSRDRRRGQDHGLGEGMSQGDGGRRDPTFATLAGPLRQKCAVMLLNTCTTGRRSSGKTQPDRCPLLRWAAMRQSRKRGS